LGLATEDAVFVFAPAGLGLVLASLFIVRFGPRIRRFVLPLAGMILMGLGLFGLGALGLAGTGSVRTPWQVDGFTFSPRWLIGILSPLAGIGLAFVLIPAQTAIQEQSTDEIRGRVFTVQLTLANGLSIPLLVAAGGLSDLFGIPQIVIALGVILFLLAPLDWWVVRQFPEAAAEPFHTQPIPLPGETLEMIPSPNPPDGSRSNHQEKVTLKRRK
jgi:MFS family permease